MLVFKRPAVETLYKGIRCVWCVRCDCCDVLIVVWCCGVFRRGLFAPAPLIEENKPKRQLNSHSNLSFSGQIWVNYSIWIVDDGCMSPFCQKAVTRARTDHFNNVFNRPSIFAWLFRCFLFTVASSDLLFSYGPPALWLVLRILLSLFNQKWTFFIWWRWTLTGDLVLRTLFRDWQVQCFVDQVWQKLLHLQEIIINLQSIVT